MSYARHCPTCGREWHDVPDQVIELFHHCRPERVPTTRAIATTAPTIEERKSALWHALFDAVGDEAAYRR